MGILLKYGGKDATEVSASENATSREQNIKLTSACDLQA